MKPVEDGPAEVSNNLLPKGTCFPLKRPSTKTPAVGQPLASALDGKPGFFAPETMKNVLEQKMLGWWSDVVDGVMVNIGENEVCEQIHHMCHFFFWCWY